MCNIWVVIASIILGVAVGTLFYLGLIPITLNFIRIAFGMSIVGMAILLGTIIVGIFGRECNPFKRCICKYGKCLLIGIIGTFLATTISTIIGVTVVSIAATIFVGLSALFFILMLVQIIALITCLINSICRKNDD